MLFIRLMTVNRVKLGRAVTFTKYLASIVYFMFLSKTLRWLIGLKLIQLEQQKHNFLSLFLQKN